MDSSSVEAKIEEINSVKKKLLFEIPWAEVKNELDSAYGAVGRAARIKGFRSGKIPRKLLEVHYKDQAEEQAISNLITKSYSDAIKKNDIMPVDHPIIDQKGIEANKDFSFTATIEIMPVVDPKDYTGLEVEKEEVNVDEGDIQERIEQLRRMYGTLEDIKEDREAVKGDYIMMDFEGKADGEALKELALKGYMVEIGSDTFFPGFEEQLLGVKKDESKEIKITLPNDFYLKNAAGKEVTFSVDVKAIKEKKLPELDDAFIENFEEYESLEDLKAGIKKSLEDEKSDKAKSDVRNRIIDRLLENNEFEVPSSWVERQINSMVTNAKQRMMSGGISPDKAAEMTQDLHDKFKDQAARAVKTSFLLGKIAEKESIDVTDEDVENKLKGLAEELSRDYETLKKAYEDSGLKYRLKDELLEQNIFDFIEGKSNIKTVKKISEAKEEKE